jgi:hypothetical protein
MTDRASTGTGNDIYIDEETGEIIFSSGPVPIAPTPKPPAQQTPPSWNNPPTRTQGILDSAARGINTVGRWFREDLPDALLFRAMDDPGFSGVRIPEELKKNQRTQQEQEEIEREEQEKETKANILAPVIPGPMANSPPGSGSGSGMGSGSGAPPVATRKEIRPPVNLPAGSLPDYRPDPPGKSMRPFDLTKLNLFQVKSFSAENSYNLNFNLILSQMSIGIREGGRSNWVANAGAGSTAMGVLQYVSSTGLGCAIKAARAYEKLLLEDYRTEYEKQKEIFTNDSNVLKLLSTVYKSQTTIPQSVVADSSHPSGFRMIPDKNPFPFFIFDTGQSILKNGLWFADSRLFADEMAFIAVFGKLATDQVEEVLREYKVGNDLLLEDKNKNDVKLGDSSSGTLDGVFPYWLTYVSHFIGSNGWFCKIDAILQEAKATDKYQWTSPALGGVLDSDYDTGTQRNFGVIDGHSFLYMKEPGKSWYYTDAEIKAGAHKTSPGYKGNYVLTSLNNDGRRLWFYGSLWSTFVSKCKSDTEDNYKVYYDEVVKPNINGTAPSNIQFAAFKPSEDKRQVLLFKNYSDKINEYYSLKDAYQKKVTKRDLPSIYHYLEALVSETAASNAQRRIDFPNTDDYKKAKKRQDTPSLDTGWRNTISGNREMSEEMEKEFPEHFLHFMNFLMICFANVGYGLYAEAEFSTAKVNITPETSGTLLALEKQMATVKTQIETGQYSLEINVGNSLLDPKTVTGVTKNARLGKLSDEQGNSRPTANPTATLGINGPSIERITPKSEGSGNQ